MMESAAALHRHISRELDRVIVGQRDLKTHCLIALLCRGHALIEGVPGIAKTLTVKTLCRLLGLGFQRVQCTSDLMPADILGTTVVAIATGEFTLHKGPAFAELLLVDEVNRMPPRTQAALLECMEERQITIDGTRYELAQDFTVFATQNPIEFEGTYPLPEAQLDRFLAKVRVPYPGPQEETQLLANVQQGFDSRCLDGMALESVPSGLLKAARDEVDRVNVEAELLGYIVEIVRRTRESPLLTLGASPRASINVLRFAKARAALDGRDYIVPDDVKDAMMPVLRHRVVLKPEADLEGLTADKALLDIAGSVNVPR